MLGNDRANLSSGQRVSESPAISGFSGVSRSGLLVGRGEVTDVRSWACVDARFGMGLFVLFPVIRVFRGSFLAATQKSAPRIARNTRITNAILASAGGI